MAILRIVDFSGGQQSKTSRFLQKTNEVIRARNVVFDKIGAVSRRLGYTPAGTAPNPGTKVHSLYGFNKRDGSTSYQLAVSGTSLYQRTVTSSSFGAWSALTSNLTASAKARFTTFLDQVFIVNGSDHPMTWDGTTFVNTDTGNVSGAPTGKFIEVYLDRVYIAKTATRPARVYFSSIPDAAGSGITWNTTDGTGDYLDTGRGPITALGTNSNRLLIFEENRLLRWDTNSLVVIAEDIGTPYQESVSNWQIYTFFFHRSSLSGLSGVYRYSGTYPLLISQKIQDEIESVKDAGEDEVCSGVASTHYYLRLKNLLFDYDIMNNDWTVHQLATNPAVFAPAGRSGFIKTYFAEDASTGRIMTFPSGNSDDGATIVSDLETKWFFPLGPETTCQFQQIHVIGDRLNQCKLFYRIEAEEVGEWMPIGEVHRRYARLLLPDGAMGRGVQFKITQTSPGEPFLLEAIVIIYEGEEVR